MRYTTEVTIDRPRDEVVRLFMDTARFPEWQDGLLGYSPLRGERGAPGATAKMTFKRGKGTMEMTETIESSTPPEEYVIVYETKGVYNRGVNRFTEAAGGRTLWTADNEFRFGGFMKLVGLVAGGSFRSQTASDMARFKEFAERS